MVIIKQPQIKDQIKGKVVVTFTMTSALWRNWVMTDRERSPRVQKRFKQQIRM